VLGGAERVLVYMLRALQENDLSIMTDSWKIEPIKRMFGVELSGVQWVKCPSFRPSSHHLVAFQWLRYTNIVNRLIRKVCGHYDLLVETQQVYVDPCSDTPLVSYIHYPDSVAPPPEGNIASSIYYALLRPIVLRRVRKIKLALTNSPFTARVITRYLKIKPLVVYPPVDTKKFYSNRGWSDREDKVVNIGTFLPFKRQQLLLEVARQLPAVQFVIIGIVSPDHHGYYEKLCTQKPNNATIVADASSDDIKKQLESAKVYVHLCPEHFGISIVEAASAGCVPIVYYVGGPAESFGDVSLKWKDLKQLSTLIKDLTKNENSWSEFSNGAREKSLEFDTSTFEQRVRNVIMNM
jgi:glycosyltransferase involved in cell wall biosynthesis